MRIQAIAHRLQQVLDAVEARANDAWRRRVAERMASGAARVKRRVAAAPPPAPTKRHRRAQPAFVRTLSASCHRTTSSSTKPSAKRADPAAARHANKAAELRWPRRRRTWILGRHGAGVEAGAAGSPHRAGDRDGGFISLADSVYSVAQQYQASNFDRGARQCGWQAVKSAVQRFIQRALPPKRSVSVALTSGRQGEQRISLPWRGHSAHTATAGRRAALHVTPL